MSFFLRKLSGFLVLLVFLFVSSQHWFVVELVVPSAASGATARSGRQTPTVTRRSFVPQLHVACRSLTLYIFCVMIDDFCEDNEDVGVYSDDDDDDHPLLHLPSERVFKWDQVCRPVQELYADERFYWKKNNASRFVSNAILGKKLGDNLLRDLGQGLSSRVVLERFFALASNWIGDIDIMYPSLLDVFLFDFNKDAALNDFGSPFQRFPYIEDIVFLPEDSLFPFDHVMISAIRIVELIMECDMNDTRSHFSKSFIGRNVNRIWSSRIDYSEGFQYKVVTSCDCIMTSHTEIRAEIEARKSQNHWFPMADLIVTGPSSAYTLDPRNAHHVDREYYTPVPLTNPFDTLTACLRSSQSIDERIALVPMLLGHDNSIPALLFSPPPLIVDVLITAPVTSVLPLNSGSRRRPSCIPRWKHKKTIHIIPPTTSSSHDEEILPSETLIDSLSYLHESQELVRIANKVVAEQVTSKALLSKQVELSLPCQGSKSYLRPGVVSLVNASIIPTISSPPLCYVD